MENETEDLFSPANDLDLVKWVLADLHDDLTDKVKRFRYLRDLSGELGVSGTMIPGQTAYIAWIEARVCFIHGNYIATIMLCQGLAEHVLAGHLSMMMGEAGLPSRVAFQETLKRSLEKNIITQNDAENLRKLMGLRNPLSHFRDINDPANLTRRMLTTREDPIIHIESDAKFAIAVAIRLLSLPVFRVGPPIKAVRNRG